MRLQPPKEHEKLRKAELFPLDHCINDFALIRNRWGELRKSDKKIHNLWSYRLSRKGDSPIIFSIYKLSTEIYPRPKGHVPVGKP